MSGLVVRNTAVVLTMAGDNGLGAVERGAVHVGAGGRVVWVGPEAALPGDAGARVLDARGGLVMPGLVDCHTHLVYADGGHARAADFAARCRGATYLEVAAAGGGILRTVGLTRAASEEDLYESARVRLERHAVRGVTTVEIKTGYGLSLDDEIKLIRVVESLRNDDRVSVIPTLLACHVVPKEWRERREDWIALVCDELITRVGSAGLAQFCDVFVEAGAYTADEARRVAGAARRVGLGVKLHVDQLGGAPGGAALAAELGAVSADHLEHADESGLRAMAGAGVVAVLLPGATAFLGERPADGRRMRALGVRVAVASDWNPGTCPTGNLWLMATLACTQSGLTVEEALRAITVEAAAALGGADGAGRLVTGAPGDLVVLDVARPEVVPYLYGDVPVRAVVRGGRTLWQAV